MGSARAKFFSIFEKNGRLHSSVQRLLQFEPKTVSPFAEGSIGNIIFPASKSSRGYIFPIVLDPAPTSKTLLNRKLLRESLRFLLYLLCKNRLSLRIFSIDHCVPFAVPFCGTVVYANQSNPFVKNHIIPAITFVKYPRKLVHFSFNIPKRGP